MIILITIVITTIYLLFGIYIAYKANDNSMSFNNEAWMGLIFIMIIWPILLIIRIIQAVFIQTWNWN